LDANNLLKKSTDNGETWGDGFKPGGATQVFSFHPIKNTNELLIGTSPYGDVFKSNYIYEIGGLSIAGPTVVYQAKLHDNTIYFTTDYTRGEIYQLSNPTSASVWKTFNDATEVYDITWWDDTIFVALDATNLLKKSLDDGGTWVEPFRPDGATDVYSFHQLKNSNELLIGTSYYGDVFKSNYIYETGGQIISGPTWIYDIAYNQTRLYIATNMANGEIWKSEDNGQSWNNLTQSSQPWYKAYSVVSLEDTLYAGTDYRGDVYKSIDDGQTWYPTGDLLNASDVYALYPSQFTQPDRLFAGTGPYGDVFVSDKVTAKLSFDKIILSGWNLIGLPFNMSNRYYIWIFPAAIPKTLFGWDGSYQLKENLEPSKGYWLRFSNAHTVLIQGYPIDSLIIDLIQDWNLISGTSSNIALTDIIDPQNIIIPGTLFEFENSYSLSDSIKQGKGYWLRTKAPGQITLISGSKGSQLLAKSFNNPLKLDQYPMLHICDASGANQILYFNVKLEDSESKLSYSLPPVPPSGLFDARFADDYRITEKDETLILLQSSHYPITISCSNLPEEDTYQYFLEEILKYEETNVHILQENEMIKIFDSQIKSLKLSKIKQVPQKFVVHQNYPNPFNSMTGIKYSIPNDSKVEITIYNTLGQRVKTLISQDKKAGNYEVFWKGDNNTGQRIGSGIYFYMVKAGNYRDIKKMVFIQ